MVLIAGLPGAGKSTLALDLVRDGYERLNRDEPGGRLADLVPRLQAHLAAGGAASCSTTRTARARHATP